MGQALQKVKSVKINDLKLSTQAGKGSLLNHIFNRHAQFFEHSISRCRHSKTVDTNDHSVEPDILPPKIRHTRFHCHTVAAGAWKYGLAVGSRPDGRSAPCRELRPLGQRIQAFQQPAKQG